MEKIVKDPKTTLPGKQVHIRFLIGVILSLASALMLILSFHPYSIWPLAFLALAPMLVAQYKLFPLKWSGLAQAIGVGGWLLVFLSAMFGSGATGLVIKLVVLGIVILQFFTVPGTRRFHERTAYRWLVPQGVADWVGVEMIRSFIPPINTHAFIAQTMYTVPWMLQPISIFSLYGLAAVIILFNYALAQALMVLLDGKGPSAATPTVGRKRAQRWLAAAGITLAVWAAAGQAMLFYAPSEGPVLTAAAVQHGFEAPGHQDTSASQMKRLETLARLTREAAGRGTQVVVWPELGLGFDPQAEHSTEIKALAIETGTYLFVGYGVADDSGWRNELVVVNPQGDFMAVYGKNHNTSPGEPPIISAGKYPVYETPYGTLAGMICNDVHYTDVARRLAREGARLIALPTFEFSGIALEQVAQAVLRAVENRTAIVKADGAYAAAIIDPYGRITALRNGSPDGAAFALTGDVRLGTGSTLYGTLGDWAGWLCLGGFVVFMVMQEAQARKDKKG